MPNPVEEKGEACTEFWWGNLKERDHWGYPGVNGGIILRWIFRKWNVGEGLYQAGAREGQLAETCKYGNEPSGSIKCGEFLDYLQTG